MKRDRKVYSKIYNAKPEVKIKHKEYDAKPEVKIKRKAYLKIYNASPKRKESQKKYCDSHKEEKKLYRNLNKEKANNARIKKKYNITPEQKKEMFDEQHGCCKICGKHQTEIKRALYVEHNHKTGNVRGLVCYKCNTIIGLAHDDITVLQNAIDYLTIN